SDPSASRSLVRRSRETTLDRAALDRWNRETATSALAGTPTSACTTPKTSPTASSAPAGPYTSNDCADAGDYVLVPADGDFATPALLLADIEANPQNYYVNVHNAEFPGGAVRGQLAVSTAPAATASSYIHPDAGAATANPNVNANSSCETPDQTDTQQVSPAGSTANNVHNDACLFDALGFDVDAQVSFDSSGVGVISGCPDPDGAGPKTATNSGTRCTLSGYQETGAMGDFEYLARLNSQVPGTQTVVFCLDPEGNGCADATIKSSITIVWFKPVNIMVMKHNCAKVNTAAQFLAVEARAATNPTTPNAAFGKTVETVLECPTVVRPGNTQTPGAVAGGTSTFEFTVGGNIDTAKTLSTDGAFTQTALCEDDVMYDANRNGTLNDNVCLDLSHYAFTVNSDGTVTITETAPPAGFSFGALRFTPGTGDDATLVSASNGVIRLNITNDADGMVMLHVYNFAAAAAANADAGGKPAPEHDVRRRLHGFDSHGADPGSARGRLSRLPWVSHLGSAPNALDRSRPPRQAHSSGRSLDLAYGPEHRPPGLQLTGRAQRRIQPERRPRIAVRGDVPRRPPDRWRPARARRPDARERGSRRTAAGVAEGPYRCREHVRRDQAGPPE
ncbi:MAG: CHRD domain-containing protein, partial [Chloroflexi bacterium]|nr:CHRD domain-containing protein [Chloroflexota bacterium]